MAMPILPGSRLSYSTAILHPLTGGLNLAPSVICDFAELRLPSENCIFLSQSLLMSLSSFIWSVADLLRGGYKQSECGKVIPFSRHFYVFSRRAEGRHG